MQKIIFLTVSGWLLASALCRAEAVLGNPSFENGQAGWEVTANSTPAVEPYAVEKSGYNSEHCLRITLPNRFGLVRIKNTQAAILDNPAEIYYLSFYCRFDNPLFIRALAVRAEYLKDGNIPLSALAGKGWELANPMQLYPADETTAGNWVRRTYTIPPVNDAKAVRIALEFTGGQGSAWLDSFTLEKGPGRIAPEKLFYYNPFKVSLGAPPYDNFVKLVTNGSPFLERADRYNRLMVQQSLAQEEMADLSRAAFYLGVKRDDAPAEENSALLRELDALYGIYGRLYLAGTPEKLPEEFDKPAARLEKKLNDFSQKSGQALNADARESGPSPSPQQTVNPKPIAIDEQGRPNQLLFASYSKDEHFDLEKTLGDVKRVYAPFADLRDVRPTADRQGLDFSAVRQTIEQWQARGVEYLMIPLPLCNVDGSLVMPDFFDRNWNNPEIYM